MISGQSGRFANFLADALEVSKSPVFNSAVLPKPNESLKRQAWKSKPTRQLVGSRLSRCNFASPVTGTRLCGDIRYLRTGEGSLYLTTVLNLCTGMIIGWSIADRMRKSLTIEAMDMAREHGYLASDQMISYSDRGSQITSAGFQAWCAGNGAHNRCQVGVRWDNAVA